MSRKETFLFWKLLDEKLTVKMEIEMEHGS